MLRRFLKILAWIAGLVFILICTLFVYVRLVSKVVPPSPISLSPLDEKVVELSPGLSTVGNNWLRKSESGLYELYVEGEPFERGVANGKLTRALVQHQEEVFTHQIHKLVPNRFYLTLLKYF
ncbi:MAG: hypothetical protein OEV74_13445, partial [Cyclobacteriaceae bacterium]|nr:hypothetical protein [Cyclobacteriaceae bacterium]